MKVRVIILLCLISLSCEASRIKAKVAFNLVNTQPSEEMIPFTVIVPETFSGYFVRFVSFNGKSAVAKVVKREGDQFRTNQTLANVIDISSDIAQVFIEEVY